MEYWWVGVLFFLYVGYAMTKAVVNAGKSPTGQKVMGAGVSALLHRLFR